MTLSPRSKSLCAFSNKRQSPRDDVAPAVAFRHSWHRAGAGRGPVGLGTLGPVLPVGRSPPLVMALGWLVFATVLAVSLVRKQRIGLVWVTAVGYTVACQVPIYLMRSSRFTALELAQTLRYLPDLVVVLALLAAVAFTAPNKPSAHWLDASIKRTVVTTGLGALFLVSSVYSTTTFLTSWRDNPAQPYLQNARAGLAAARAASNAPLLEQEVDPLVLQRMVWPETWPATCSPCCRTAGLRHGSTQLRMLNRWGQVVDAKVTWLRTIVPGPTPQCGYWCSRTRRRG